MELHQKKVVGVRKHSLRMENRPGSLNVIVCNDMAGEADREGTGSSTPASAGSDFCFSITLFSLSSSGQCKCAEATELAEQSAPSLAI